eukprot:1160430-Pelagomonas_calceolata.AAC.7
MLNALNGRPVLTSEHRNVQKTMQLFIKPSAEPQTFVQIKSMINKMTSDTNRPDSKEQQVQVRAHSNSFHASMTLKL